ncbi:MAG: redoxin domain-containing protein [Spongiibacteraceae bacterium]|nr:redoxin domain-containing protein [Spongiibacteraceae bacterium]
MKQVLVSLLFLNVLFCSFVTQAKITIDQAAPDFSLLSASGKKVALSDYKGKYVVLEWTNHQCPYVKKHYGSNNMQGLQKKYTAKDVVWLSVISSAPGKQGHVDAQKAKQLTEQRQAAPTHVLFDPDGVVGKTYGAKTTPHMYIIDPQGTLRYAGAIDSIKSANPADINSADNYLDLGLSALMAGKQVAQKLTAPYGCGVKYGS